MRNTATRIVAAVTRLHPNRVSDPMTADMLAVFAREYDAVRATRGRVAAATLLLKTLAAVVVEALRARFGRRRPSVAGLRGPRPANAVERLHRTAGYARYGVRVWRKTPGHALVAVAALAIGIGVNVAVLGLIGTLFFHQPPTADPHELVSVVGKDARGTTDAGAFSLDDARDLAASVRTVSDLAAYSTLWVQLDLDGGTEELLAAKVTGNFFELLGMRPAAGRFFGPDEDAVPERDAVVVISYELWRRRFGGDPAVVGRELRFNERRLTVVGVAPAGFTGLWVEQQHDVWIPTMMGGIDGWAEQPYSREARGYDLVARRRPDSTLEQARAELDGVVAGMARPDDDRVGAFAYPVRGATPGTRRAVGRTPALAIAVAGALLLITCLNLAGLLLARNVGRQHEFATRRAIGATRGSLAAQLLTEALTLAVVAGLVGLASAAWTQRLLESWYAYALPGLRLRLDGGSALLLLAFVIGSAAALGLVPAWSASRQGIGGSLHGARGAGARGGFAGARALSTLVVAQVALSLMLLMGAAVMLRTVENVLAAAGGSPDGVVHYRLRPSRVGYTPDNARPYQDRLLAEVGAVPEVRSVTLARVGPDAGWCCPVPVRLPGDDPDGARLMVDNNHVTPAFFDTLQIPILRGRGFRDSDDSGAPLVAIVNEALAERLWPGQEALGRRLVADESEYEVIGVTPNLIAVPAGDSPYPYLWLAYWQADLVDARLYARVTGAGAGMVQEVRANIAAIDPAVHIGQEATLADRTRLSMAAQQVLFGVLQTCAVVAMLLTALGMYGQLSLSVGQRRREIGVRMALGASSGAVARDEIRRALLTVGIGLAVGVAATWGQAQLLRAYATGVAAFDTVLLVGSCLLLLVVAAVAAFMPARRAARVDPMLALRRQ